MDFEWNDEAISKLRELWGLMPSAEIARQIGTTKNSAVGKAHRLGLPVGESPVAAQATFDDEKIEELKLLAGTALTSREIGQRLGFHRSTICAKLAALGISRQKSATDHPRKSRAPNRPLPVARAKPTGPLKASVYRQAGRSEPCTWPIGMPKTPSFRYCDAPSMQGRAYCEQHFAIAHRDVCERHEEAA